MCDELLNRDGSLKLSSRLNAQDARCMYSFPIASTILEVYLRAISNDLEITSRNKNETF